MKFYGRKKEIKKIREYFKLVKSGNSKMLVITGRRRIGKTPFSHRICEKYTPFVFFCSQEKDQ